MYIYIYIQVSPVLPHVIITPYNDINLYKFSIDHQTTMKSPQISIKFPFDHPHENPSPHLPAAAHEGLREKRPSCGGDNRDDHPKIASFWWLLSSKLYKQLTKGLGKSVPQIPIEK